MLESVLGYHPAFAMETVALTVVVPMYNEEENVDLVRKYNHTHLLASLGAVDSLNSQNQEKR